MERKGKLITVEKIQEKWYIVGRQSRNIYYSGTKVECREKLKEDDEDTIIMIADERQWIDSNNDKTYQKFYKYLEGEKK